ncbi:DMT family transporter [Pararhodobacter aggregans]|uniref:DMT family transporter n=1 Tax=Pararhodobacter aggregans TaxID=404875 RepID=UPI003A8F9AEE
MTAASGMRGRAEALKGHAAMLGFSAAVSGSFSLGALVANDIGPVPLTAARFLCAALVLALLVALLPGAGRAGRRGFARADLAAPWRYGLLALLYGGYFVLMFEGLKTAHPLSAGAVFTLTPLMTAALAWPMLGQRLRTSVVAPLAVGAAGAVWVIFRGDPGALMRLEIGPGEAIYFLGCVLHAIYAPMLRLLNRGESALVTAALVTAFGFVLFLAWGWAEVLATDWAALPARVWVALAYLAVFATAFAASAMQFAAQRLPASKVMAYTYATPVWIILWELALGHGVPGWVVLPGVVLIVVALLILLKGDQA